MNRNRLRILSATTLVAGFLLGAFAQSAWAAVPKVMTIPVPSTGGPMAAKMDAQGRIHLVYETPKGPFYTRFEDDNCNMTFAPLPLVVPGEGEVFPSGLEFITWDVAVATDGAVHVALGNNAWKLKLPHEQWGYFYTRLLPGEKSFSPLKNINQKPSEGFSLALNDKGLVTAVWMADKLYANVSEDGGKTFAATVEIDPVLNPCNCCTTSSTYGADGRLAILYREETNDERDMYLALWDQAKNQVSKTRISTTPWKIDSCPMTYYSVVPSGEGYLAAWPTKGEIYFAKLGANGVPIAPKEIKTRGASGMRSGILPIGTIDGQTLVVWKKENQLGWQLFDRSGRPSGLPDSVKSEGKGVAGVVAKDGTILLFK